MFAKDKVKHVEIIELVQWWLYENVEKTIWINKGKPDEIKINVHSDESFVDYLIKEYN